MKKIILLCTACLLTIACLAQEPTGIFASDTLSTPSSNIKKKHQKKSAERNLHYNILGGPSFSPDFGLLVGGSALMTFRMNPQDTTMRRSVLPVAMAFMFKGGLNIMVKPQLFFKDDKFRIFGQFSYKNTQENFYGVGYSETNAVGLVEPANTPALMYLMYGMFAVTVIATLVGAIAQFGGALKDNPKGAIKSLIGLILLIVLLIVTYNIGSSETVIMGGGTEYTNVTMLKVTDMLLYSTYVLFGLAAIGTLINLSGIFKK